MSRFHRRKVSALLIAAYIAALRLLYPSTSFAGQSRDQNSYLGRRIASPENLSGIWEAPDGHGGIIALHLTLLATAPGSATTLTNLPLAWFALEAALYHSPTADLSFNDGNSFSDSERGGSLRYEHNRLTLHWAAFDLDLVHTPRDQWKGYLRRPGFHGEVALRRPHASANKKAWLEGAWLNANSPSPSCLHIAVQPSGRYLAWSDNLQLTGLWRFANGIRRPATSSERFGELIDVEAAGPAHATITTGAHTGLCCSHTFVVSRSGRNAFLRIDSPAVQNFPSRTSTWTRMPANACLAAPR